MMEGWKRGKLTMVTSKQEPRGMQCFVQDESSHWHLIPLISRQYFMKLSEEDSHEAWEIFEEKFNKYRIDSPTHYCFENSEKI